MDVLLHRRVEDCQESPPAAAIEAASQRRVSEGALDKGNHARNSMIHSVCNVATAKNASSSGEQTHPEHAEAGAALCDLWIPLLEDCEGADLQAWLRKGLGLRITARFRCEACLASQGQQAAHPPDLQRHHL